MFNFMRMATLLLTYFLCANLYAGSQDTMNAEIEKVVSDAREIYQLPAVAVSIRLPSGKWIEAYQGNMNKNSDVPIDDNTLFQVGSVTKTFTAVLILKLAEMKQLNLNDPLSKYLPEYSNWSNITLLQLLNHTSGIYDYMDVPFWWFRLDLHRSKIWTPKELADLSYGHALYFPAGTGWHYSNTDYVLLGMVVEKATHLPFKVALDRYVLSKENDMPHTYYFVDRLPAFIEQKLAHGYRNNKRDMTSINTSWGQAGAAMISNTHDLADWYWRIFSLKVVTQEMLTKITQFVSLNNGQPLKTNAETGYGLGVFSMLTPYGVVWFTPGLTPGYVTAVVWSPCRKTAFAYTTNSTTSKKGLHAYLMGQLLKVISEQDAKECVSEPKSNKIIFPNF